MVSKSLLLRFFCCRVHGISPKITLINYFPAIATIILAHIIPTTDKRKLAMTQCLFLLLYFSLLNTRKSFILKNNTLGIFHHGMILKYDSSIFPHRILFFFITIFREESFFKLMFRPSRSRGPSEISMRSANRR